MTDDGTLSESGTPDSAPGSDNFPGLARRTLDELLERHPEAATTLGDHRFDDRLTDLGPEALDDEQRWATRPAGRAGRPPAGRTSLRPTGWTRRSSPPSCGPRLFGLQELRDHEWDPLVANPGTAIYTLLAREFAPLGDRLRSAAGRLHAVPHALDTARASLREMPRVHVETAIGQFAGTRTLLATELERALTQEPALRSEVEPARDQAIEAIDDAHRLAAVPARRRGRPRAPARPGEVLPQAHSHPRHRERRRRRPRPRRERPPPGRGAHRRDGRAARPERPRRPDRYAGCSTGSPPTARSPTRRSSGCASRRCSRPPSS